MPMYTDVTVYVYTYMQCLLIFGYDNFWSNKNCVTSLAHLAAAVQ